MPRRFRSRFSFLSTSFCARMSPRAFSSAALQALVSTYTISQQSANLQHLIPLMAQADMCYTQVWPWHQTGERRHAEVGNRGSQWPFHTYPSCAA